MGSHIGYLTVFIFTNVLILNPKMKQTYYWKSLENEFDFNTAEWNTNLLLPLIKELLQKGFILIGLVLDNENLNNCIFKMISG